MPSKNGQVTFWTGPTTQSGDDNLFWDNTQKGLRIGPKSFLYNILGDLWSTENMYWDGANWRRFDTNKPAFTLNFRSFNAIPYETNGGVVLWVALAGSNPISSLKLGWALTEFKDLVIGGYGIEIDGNGPAPYGRVINNTSNVGIMTNLYLDLAHPGRDILAQSWFAGFVGDSFKVRRDPIPASKTSSPNWQDFLHIDSVGKVGIGTTNPPTNILTIQQNSPTDPIADAWTTYSSKRWKTNIKPIEGALEKVQRLNGIEFDSKLNGKHDIGLIAEDVSQVIPEVVTYEDNGKEAKSIDYARLVSVLIEAVQTQQKEIEELKAAVDNITVAEHDTNKLAGSLAIKHDADSSHKVGTG